MDNQAYVNLGTSQERAGRKLYTHTDLLVAMFDNPKARFELSYPVYRVRGQGSRKLRVLPEFGIRATQGHVARPEIGPGFFIAAQEANTLG